MKTIKRALNTTATALVLAAAETSVALAQGADTLGITPVEQAAIAGMKLIAIAAIGWGFMRLMSGRHTVEGLVALGVGGLGLAKTSAITALFGF
jgi:hypothetical protein